jgi:LPXTG-motif cell wall-anchored protein
MYHGIFGMTSRALVFDKQGSVTVFTASGLAFGTSGALWLYRKRKHAVSILN